MTSLISQWIGVCLLRVRPQDLPASLQTVLPAVLVYFLVNVFLSLLNEPLRRAIYSSLLDLAILYVFVRIALLIRHTPDRLMQTITALTGSGAVLGFVALPIVAAGQSGSAIAGIPALLWLSLLIWSIGVFGHVMRHALSVTLPVGVLIAIAYLVISVRVMQRLLPPAVT